MILLQLKVLEWPGELQFHCNIDGKSGCKVERYNSSFFVRLEKSMNSSIFSYGRMVLRLGFAIIVDLGKKTSFLFLKFDI